MDLTSRSFVVDGTEFTVNFTRNDAYVWAALVSSDPQYLSLAHVITVGWAKNPVELLQGLESGEFLQTGGFNTIEYSGDVVDINEDGEELQVERSFFSAIVMELARCHLAVVGSDYFPWWKELNASLAQQLLK